MGVMIVGTETTQGFTVGLTTQGPSGRVWETQPFDVTFDTLEIWSPEKSCTQVETREFEHQTTLA